MNTVGLKSIITDDFEEINKSKSLIIPDVGAFPEAMRRLKDKGLVRQFMIVMKKGKYSWNLFRNAAFVYRAGNKRTKGLNLIPGKVEKFS